MVKKPIGGEPSGISDEPFDVVFPEGRKAPKFPDVIPPVMTKTMPEEAQLEEVLLKRANLIKQEQEKEKREQEQEKEKMESLKQKLVGAEKARAELLSRINAVLDMTDRLAVAVDKINWLKTEKLKGIIHESFDELKGVLDGTTIVFNEGEFEAVALRFAKILESATSDDLERGLASSNADWIKLHTKINLALEAIIKFEAESAALVAIDPKTGATLAARLLQSKHLKSKALQVLEAIKEILTIN